MAEVDRFASSSPTFTPLEMDTQRVKSDMTAIGHVHDENPVNPQLNPETYTPDFYRSATRQRISTIPIAEVRHWA
jgi:hypothetical protein